MSIIREKTAAATETAAEMLAAHFCGLTFEQLPAHRVETAKTLFRDYFGVALGGSRTGSGKIAARFCRETGGQPQATIIGDGARVPAVHAAMANAIASHSIELDDVDVLALFHFSPPVVSAAIATAEMMGSSGRELLTAVVAGCEVMSRVSHATNFSLRDRGFHTTPTCGVFGAAIAAALLMRLEPEQTVSALGLAGAQASGLMEMYGPSMQKRFNPGPAARNGVFAAQMAKAGFTGAATILDGERGFCRGFSDEDNLAPLTRDLGPDYPDEFEYKAYSCARPIHNAIDCALNIRREMKRPVSETVAIAMRRHPKWAKYHQNARPKTYHEAQVSLPYSVAVALIDGAALFPQYADERLGDPEILRLAGLVEIQVDESLPRGVSCLMELKTASGEVHRSQVDHPKGSIKNPMSREEMERKVHLLAEPAVGSERVRKLIAAIDELDRAPDIRGLMNSVVPAEPASAA